VAPRISTHPSLSGMDVFFVNAKGGFIEDENQDI